MAGSLIPELQDRLAADVFQKSYRQYLALKPTHYRWYELAPQSVRHLQEAEDRHWSVEKIADYLHCEPEEAAACQRRFIMSKKVNAKDTTAARIRQGFFEWIGGVMELDEKAKENLAVELSQIVANQLYGAALAHEDLMKLSLALEGKEGKGEEAGKVAAPKPPVSKDGPPSQWGPQWKD